MQSRFQPSCYILLMSEFKESAARRGNFTGLHDEGVGRANGYSYSSPGLDGGAAGKVGDLRFQVVEFAKGAAEMSVEFGKGVRDVVKQTILREDSVITRKFKGPCLKIVEKLRFLNEYLPEDRDPVHVWTIIAGVWFFTLAGDSFPLYILFCLLMLKKGCLSSYLGECDSALRTFLFGFIYNVLYLGYANHYEGIGLNYITNYN